MLGYKKSGDDGYIIVDVEVNESGEPIVPEGVLLDPPPVPDHGYVMTIENGEWVQVEERIYIPPETLEDVRFTRQLQINQWKRGYMEQPFIYEGYVFANDSASREVLNSAMSAMKDWDIVPSVWISANGVVIDSPTRDFMNGLSKKAYIEQEKTRTFVFRLQGQITSEQNIDALRNITFPEYPTVDDLVYELTK